MKVKASRNTNADNNELIALKAKIFDLEKELAECRKTMSEYKKTISLQENKIKTLTRQTDKLSSAYPDSTKRLYDKETVFGKVIRNDIDSDNLRYLQMKNHYGNWMDVNIDFEQF